MRTTSTLLKARLDGLCARYDTPMALAKDPLSVPLAYPGHLDQEVAAFVAANLAYGRVEPMLRAITTALAPLGRLAPPALRRRGQKGPAGWALLLGVALSHPRGSHRMAAGLAATGH